MRLTDDELHTGQLTPERLNVALEAFQVAGLLSMERILKESLCRTLRLAIQNELPTAEFLEAPGAPGIGSTFFDFVPPFSDPNVVANPILLQVLRAIFRSEFTCSVYQSNISLPGSTIPMAIHVDHPNVYHDGSVRNCQLITCHLLLTDFTNENGSTEYWPGTHLTAKRINDPLGLVAGEIPSIRLNRPAGTAVIRESAVWHRGMPNHTQMARAMITMCFAPKGSPTDGKPWHRPLRVTKRVLDALPIEARSVWSRNIVDDESSAPLGVMIDSEATGT